MSILRYLGFPGCLTAMTPRSVSNSWHFAGFSGAAGPGGGWRCAGRGGRRSANVMIYSVQQQRGLLPGMVSDVIGDYGPAVGICPAAG
jgi:hypothetical protein